MVLVLPFTQLGPEEQALALSAQGILNRQGQKIFAAVDNYMAYLHEEWEYADLFGLIAANAGRFCGAAVYDLSPADVSVNMAATLSAAYDILGVPRALINKITALGIPVLCDLAQIKGSPAARQRTVWQGVKHLLSKTALVHQVVKPNNFHIRLRDFSICNRWACIYTGEGEEDRAFRREVLSYLNKNIPVYGWNDDEIAFINDISGYGDYAVPTDWSLNHSYFKPRPYNLAQNKPRPAVKEGKHYVALVVSDGDNVQWLERDFSTTGPFGQRQNSPLNYKLTWTFSPSLAGLCPDAAGAIYSGGKNDYFISGVSGIGYANILAYPREHLGGFARLTAEGMRGAGLNVLCLLDNIKNTSDDNFVKGRLHFFTQYDNIYGGIWELDPNRYSAGGGKIFWSDNKPFVSVRFTLWHPSNISSLVTDDWLAMEAAQVNAVKPSPHTPQGYSVINVHPWTIDIAALDRFVSMLGDDVELVYADELLELIKRNVNPE